MPDIQKFYVNERLWNNIAGRILNTIPVNQAHPHASGSMNYAPDPRGTLADDMSINPKWEEMLEIGRAVARHFSRVTYALYGIQGNAGPAYSAYGYFYVDPYYHTTHFNNVVSQITNQVPPNPSPAGMSLAQIEANYNAFSSVIINNVGQQVPDLRICHGSCHSNCHNSRGRR